ncbi:alginate export family protein [Thioalkalicoccus limnaeus]|uniref:Alginate export family protein n=2 Tax=Thioalkalicoccus limnaeus TaxID=120681 RepID=A0ABV4BNY8_9GAMM
MLVWTLVWMMASGTAVAQTGAGIGVGVGGGPGYEALQPLYGGETITAIIVMVEPPDAPGAERLDTTVRDALSLRPGDPWNPILGAAVRARLEARPDIRAIEFARREIGGGVERQLIVTVFPATVEASKPPRGLLVTGDPGDFPLLYRKGGRYLRVILNGGFGIYSDGNPWFDSPETFTRGNPLVVQPAEGAGTGSRASWAEAFVQIGVGGVTPVGGDDLYGFGALSGIGPGSVGRDIFRDDPRATFDLELAYAGLLYAPQDERHRFKVSAGRQNFTLNSGFLISQFGSQWNAGPRPGVYMSPRTAHDFAFLASGRLGDWSAQAFWLDPNENEPIESHTRVAGLNLRRQTTRRWALDGSLIYIPRSDTRYLAPDARPRLREGLWTVAGHAHRGARPGAPGAWLEAELAYQWHDDFPMAAWAGYAEAGWIARTTPWTPSISYRLSSFSGDDPDTSRYERFDTLYSGGLDQWLQGISINKVLTQANRRTHRVRLNLSPTPRLNLTFDVYKHTANEKNNLGANPALGTLASRDLGEEIQLTVRWALSQRLFLQGIAGIAFPGSAIEDATDGDAEPWNTAQLQLFWGF